MSKWTPTKDGEVRLKSIIRKLATSGEPELDSTLLSEIKQICKTGGDVLIQVAYKYCLHHLIKPHSQIRVSVVKLIDYFFRKTHKFRLLLLDDFDSFLELTIQVSQDKHEQIKLPPPKKYARILKENTAKCIYRWHADYSVGYEKLRYAYRYLREHGIVDFGQFRVSSHEDQLRQAQIQRQRERQLDRLVEQKLKQLEELYPNMEDLIVQIESLLEILMPSVYGGFEIEGANDNTNKTEQTDTNIRLNEGLQEHGMPNNNNYVIPIEFSRYVPVMKEDENKEIIGTLKEFRHQLVETKIEQLNSIIKALSRRSDGCTSEIKRAIDLKHRAMNSIIKMSELKILTMEDLEKKSDPRSGATLNYDSSDDESDEFEEIQPKEDLESYIPKHLLQEYGLEPAIDTPEVRLINDDEHLFGPSTSSGRLGAISQCNAMLPTGKLCPRKDKIKCPFHGLIVERDLMGVPIKEEDRLRERKSKELKRDTVPDWQDPTLLMEIKAATGIDLTMPASKNLVNKKVKRSKLENTKTCDLTPQQRLQKRMKKICSS